ncbi:MAG: hypothetical protein Q9176_006071 [Flavoplaca citrina]
MIAPFLVPVEAAEEVATDAGTKLYDLAILGSEATARFLKNSGSSAGHFACEEAWAAAKKSSTNSINFRLLRRGNIISSCCALATLPPSKALKDFEARIDVTDGAITAGDDDPHALDGQASEPYPSNEALYEPTDYNAITEADNSTLQSTSSETHAFEPIYL